jgi:hypothetical protein
MKTSRIFFVNVLTVFLFSMLFVQYAHAVTPTLSLVSAGSGDNVLVTVTGDPNYSVILNYLGSSSQVQMSSIGTTNSSGSFSTTLSTATYGIVPNNLVNVSVNNQRSQGVVWPYVSGVATSTTNLSLSQTSLTILSGQSSIITANNNTSSGLYLSSNSNPSIANVSINANQVTITALTYGSTVISVCAIGNSSNCASASVTVQGSGTQSLLFNQNNVSITSGQTVQISVAGGNSAYTVTNNSNPNVIQATISGQTVNLYTNTSSGSATITVCSTNMSSCGIITATAVPSNSTSALSFSQTNPVISIGQTSTITVSGGGSGTYYISSNSNPSIVQANIVSGTVTLFANSSGSSNITICSSTGGCGIITSTVTALANGGTIALSQSNLTLLVGQSVSITVSGASSPYSLTNPGTVFQSTISGNTITISGVAPGSYAVPVCSANGSCALLSVVVASISSGGNQPILSQSYLNLTSGQGSNVSISGNGGYYISSNTNSNVATAIINGNNISITANNSGTTNLLICQSGGQCTTLSVSVNGSSSTNNTTTTSNPLSSITMSQIVPVGSSISLSISGGSGAYNLSGDSYMFSSILHDNVLILTGLVPGIASVNICSSNTNCLPINVMVINAPASNVVSSSESTTVKSSYKFTKQIKYGQSGTEVIELQKKLTEAGVYSGPINGKFGDLTLAAVKRYQRLNKLEQLGSVGPATRALLNQ